jgi:NADH-quinone oxidoreductase subunit J
MIEITFYIFAALMVIAAVMVVSLKNPVHSVLFLIFTFFNAAALFILINAEYVAMILLIVYVGAVAVLFLFVVMMIDQNDMRETKNFFATLPLSIVLSIIIFLEIYWALERSSDALRYVINVPSGFTNTELIGLNLYTKYAIHFQMAGLILLVAMIGAILLTLRHSKKVKRQNVYNQVSRKRSDSINLIDVRSNEGVTLP